MCFKSDEVFNLFDGFFGLRSRQIDLIYNRNELEVILNCQVRVGQRLSLDALRRIDDQ